MDRGHQGLGKDPGRNGPAVLVDDFEGYVHPGQHAQWVRIDCFDHPYELSDKGLSRVLRGIRQRLG